MIRKDDIAITSMTRALLLILTWIIFLSVLSVHLLWFLKARTKSIVIIWCLDTSSPIRFHNKCKELLTCKEEVRSRVEDGFVGEICNSCYIMIVDEKIKCFRGICTIALVRTDGSENAQSQTYSYC